MIGAVCFKVTNEYEVRIYMVGTYEQIDWTNPSPCVLGENYTCYALKNEEAGNAIQIVTGLNGQHMLRLFETKRYESTDITANMNIENITANFLTIYTIPETENYNCCLKIIKIRVHYFYLT